MPLGCRFAGLTSLRYGERLAGISAAPSIGSGDSCGNALADARKSVDAVELATFLWVSWLNTTRLHGTLGDMTTTGYEDAHYVHQAETNQLVGVR